MPLLAISLLVFTNASAQSESVELDQRILRDTDREFGGVYRDMGVVQRKAMNKAHRILLSAYGSLDFSDRPYSSLGFNFDPGFAISDFWEIYVHYTPYYRNQLRQYARDLSNYEDPDTLQQPVADVSKMKNSYGGAILWAPTYGKDSIGSRAIIRSDTFFKAGFYRLNFISASTNQFFLGVGKTFFLGKYIGMRFTAQANYMGLPNLAGDVKYSFIGTGEIGAVFYW